jgi:hypothetical protein
LAFSLDSYLRFSRIWLSTDCDERTPTVIYCRRPGSTLLIFATILCVVFGSVQLASQQASESQREISVQFLDFRSGKPIQRLNVIITFWNGDPGSHGRIDPNNVVHETSMRTDKDGKVTVPVPEPVPNRLIIFQPDLVDSFSPDFSPTEVLASGTVTTYRHDKSASRLQVSAKPGEIVILNKRLTAWDRMRQEIP